MKDFIQVTIAKRKNATKLYINISEITEIHESLTPPIVNNTYECQIGTYTIITLKTGYAWSVVEPIEEVIELIKEASR